MKTVARLYLILFPVILLLIMDSGCSEREKTPVVMEDSTFIYPSSEPGGINAGITLCKSVRKNGKRVGSGTVFTIKTDESVRACVDLENIRFDKGRNITFHVDWIDAEDNSMFLKRIDLSPADSIQTLLSSLSINPDKRIPGNYKVRVYLFRELIAEKKFRLISEAQAEMERLKAKLTLCRSVDKITGERIGIDTVFTIGDKEKIRAFADITDPGKRGSGEMAFLFDWTDTAGKSLYRKEITISSLDSASLLSSAISISPENRQPGIYQIKFYLAEDVIAEQRFEIKAAPVVAKPEKHEKPEIKAVLTLCLGTDKKTGERTGIDTVFTIKENEKVRVFADLVNPGELGGRKSEFHFDWADATGKSFYRKEVDFSPGDPAGSLTSSISIAPGKREPGIYICRLYLKKQKIAEKKFRLKN